MNNRKIIIIILTTFSVIYLLFVLISLINKFDTVTTGLDINVVPSDSEIYIDNNKVGSGINETSPGNHTVLVKRHNFNDNESTVTVIKNEVDLVIVGLTPNNDAGKLWQQNNLDQYHNLEGMADEKFNNDSQSAIAQYPILSELPKDKSPLYRIDYGVSKKFPNDKKKIAIYISSNSLSNKLSALNYIYEMRYDPSDYEIIFQELK